MIDHIEIIGSNFEKSKACYVDELAATGYQILAEMSWFPLDQLGWIGGWQRW